MTPLLPQALGLRLRRKIHAHPLLSRLVPPALLFAGRAAVLRALLERDPEALRRATAAHPAGRFRPGELRFLFHLAKSSHLPEDAYRDFIAILATGFLDAHAVALRGLCQAIGFADATRFTHDILPYRGLASLFLDKMTIARTHADDATIFLKVCVHLEENPDIRRQLDERGIRVPALLWTGPIGGFTAAAYPYISGGHPPLKTLDEFHAVVDLARTLSTLRVARRRDRVTSVFAIRPDDIPDGLPPEDQARFRHVFGWLAAHEDRVRTRLAALPEGFNHSDFSLQNLLVQDGELVLLDYAGGGMGFLSYDLAYFLFNALESVLALHDGDLAAVIATSIARFHGPEAHPDIRRAAEWLFLLVGLNLGHYQLGRPEYAYADVFRNRFLRYLRRMETFLPEASA